MKKKYDIKTTDVETLKKWYHLMTLGRALDEKAPSYLLQSLGWSYHAPYAGHDGIQLAVGQVFTLLCYWYTRPSRSRCGQSNGILWT